MFLQIDSLNAALQLAATHWDERVFLKMDGRNVTFGQFDYDVRRLALGLREKIHISSGDRVAVLMRNSIACVQTWLATNYLGAIWVPINTGFRHRGLAHALSITEPAVVICDDELLPAL
ncbi:AMP-binding protein, partial [Phytoactinopolyspora endophytica]|uniref:AMP-binding protein n=1 Tax=Phytoactinopolyspora endophytica TaxID=1642495 RepID=UPI00197B1CBE